MLALLFSDIQSRFLTVGKVTGVAVGDGDGGPFTSHFWDDATSWDDASTFTD